jgi:hypothetical protein
MTSTTTILGIVSVVAVIVGPLITLSIQRWTEDRREKRQARQWVFRTLMMYRATPLAHSYVQALNLIDVVFNADSKKEKAVRTGWKVLLNHLDKGKGKPDFFEKSQNHTAVLLAAMGACLGYDFDEVYLKQHAYQPQGHGQIEEEQNAIRRLQLQVLQGTRRLPIAIFPDQFPEVVLPPGEIPSLLLNEPTPTPDGHDA